MHSTKNSGVMAATPTTKNSAVSMAELADATIELRSLAEKEAETNSDGATTDPLLAP